MRSLPASTALCLLLTLGLGCSTEAPRPIVIGLLLPAASLPREVQAAELAVREINAAGGVRLDAGRRPFELAVADSERLPGVAISAAYELIHTRRSTVLLGLPLSYNAIPVGQVAESNGVPMVSTRSSHPETTAGWRGVFRLCYLDSFQAEVLARFALGELAARRAATLVEAANAYSASLAEQFRRRFEASGGEIIAAEIFTDPTADVGGPMRRLAASRPQVLLLPYFGGLVRTHMEAAREAGIEATLLGGDSWGAVDAAPPGVAGPHYFVDVWAPDRDHPRSARFVAAFADSFGSEPTNGAALTYDGVYLLRRAIEETGSVDRQALRASLEAITDFEGVTGTISFAEGHDPRRSAFVRAVADDGSRRLVAEVPPG